MTGRPFRPAERAMGAAWGSHSTVKHHVANARSMVGATTTAQLAGVLGPRMVAPEDRPVVRSSWLEEGDREPMGYGRRDRPSGEDLPPLPRPVERRTNAT